MKESVLAIILGEHEELEKASDSVSHLPSSVFTQDYGPGGPVWQRMQAGADIGRESRREVPSQVAQRRGREHVSLEGLGDTGGIDEEWWDQLGSMPAPGLPTVDPDEALEEYLLEEKLLDSGASPEEVLGILNLQRTLTSKLAEYKAKQRSRPKSQQKERVPGSKNQWRRTEPETLSVWQKNNIARRRKALNDAIEIVGGDDEGAPGLQGIGVRNPWGDRSKTEGQVLNVPWGTPSGPEQSRFGRWLQLQGHGVGDVYDEPENVWIDDPLAGTGDPQAFVDLTGLASHRDDLTFFPEGLPKEESRARVGVKRSPPSRESDKRVGRMKDQDAETEERDLVAEQIQNRKERKTDG